MNSLEHTCKLQGHTLAMAVLAVVSLLLVFVSLRHSYGQLSSTFYDNTCPNVTSIVRNVIQQAVNEEARMAASLLRLHFHDCFINGCDASILLPAPNMTSTRGFAVVDNVKSAVESSCPGVVSCADILALSARESVVALNGPSWTVVFGRRDSTSATAQATANTSLPPPTSTASFLISNFSKQGLSQQDLVALSGAHTIGQAQCAKFRARLYNSSHGDQMDTNFNTSLQSNCPMSGGDSTLSPLDLQTPTKFDNLYFKNLQKLKGLLFSDQTLYSGGQSSTKQLVDSYAANHSTFFKDFSTAMVNMGNIKPLTGSSGEIRASCGKTN